MHICSLLLSNILHIQSYQHAPLRYASCVQLNHNGAIKIKPLKSILSLINTKQHHAKVYGSR